jgi:hypothetical protein
LLGTLAIPPTFTPPSLKSRFAQQAVHISKLVRLSLFSLCLTESCLIFLEGGVFISVVFMLQYFGAVNNGSFSVCGSAGLIMPTRSDYGGRLSLLTLHLPLLVLISMLSILWMFHSSFYGSWVNIYWLVAGFILMLSEWYRVGMWESRFQATTSFKINTNVHFSCSRFRGCLFP